MKSIKILSLLLFVCVHYCSAQDNPLYLEPNKEQADSLRAQLQKNLTDTLRMAAWRDLSLYYLDINTDSSLYFIGQALSLAQQLQLKLWEADAWDLAGVNFRNQGNHARSLKAFNEALRIVENKECEKKIWRISKFTNSKKPEFARLSMLATIQSDMIELYGALNNYEKELLMIRQSVSIATQINDNTVLSQAYRQLGRTYLRNDLLDSALILYNKYLEYAEKAGFRKYSSMSFNNIGHIYLKKKQNRQALESYFHALQISKEQNNYWGMGNSYVSISNYYNTINQLDSALYYAKEGLATLKQSGQVRYFAEAYNALVAVYKNLNMPDSALLNMEIVSAIKDSLIGLEKIKQFQNVESDEQYRIQELEKERIKTEGKIRTYGLLSGLGVIIIVASILYRSNRHKQRVNRVLEATLVI